MKSRIFISLLLVTIFKNASAQDVEQAAREAKEAIKYPVRVSGSIGANTVLYQAYGLPPRRDPFYWVVNANLNFILFNKVTVPFTAVLTQQDKNFTNGLDQFSQPFNQFGISPRYRWLTVHAGYRSLEFSEYTLAGAMFLGGGVEVKPKKSLVSGTAFAGRFVKAIPKGGVDGILVSLPAYARYGGGGQVQAGDEKNSCNFIFLKIRDDVRSIPFDTALHVTPHENQVLGFGGRTTVVKGVTAAGEIALSMLTKNLYENSLQVESYSYINRIYQFRPSSQFNKAINASLDYAPGKIRFGLKYKRVDPDYRTLGAVFLTNDVEEVSANTGFSIFKNKVNLNLAGGLQQNNLDRIQQATSQRIIGSADLAWMISSHLNLGFNYSSFSSNAIPVRDAFSDSIRFVQLTENGGMLLNYSFGKNRIKHTITSMGNLQRSGGTDMQESTFLNETFSYSLLLPERELSVQLSILYNQGGLNGVTAQQGMGPQLAVQKSAVNNKLRINVSAGFQDVLLQGQPLSRNISSGLGLNFTIDKNQSLKADCMYISRHARQAQVQSFSEVRGSFGYVYNFGIKPKPLFSKKEPV